MKPNIVIIGDSHVCIYSFSTINSFFNCVKIIHSDSEDATRFGKFTPYLMNTIADKGEFYLHHHIDKYKNTTQYIMYIFGEPDVRIHFDKQINILKRNEDEVIETLCKNYIKKIIEITPNPIKIIIRYVMPQRIYSMFGEYVPRGNIIDRVKYTIKINLMLKELCEKNGLLFFDNSEIMNLVEEDGSLRDIYCDGTTHYNSNAISFVNKEIEHFFNHYVKTD